MRKIKFRGWDTKENRMLTPDDPWTNPVEIGINITHPELIMSLRGKLMLIAPIVGGNLLKVVFSKDYILMQFTGLKDKNDKDIYEGDIIKYPFGYDYRVDQVIFSDSAQFYLEPIKHPLYYEAFPQDGTQKCEVIGNIYENPELLNEDSK